MTPEAIRALKALQEAQNAIFNLELGKVSIRTALAYLNDAFDEAIEAKIIFVRTAKIAERANERAAMIITKGPLP